MLSACTSSSGNGSPAASFVKDDQSICRLDRRSRLQHAATMAVNDTPSHQLLFVGSVTAATASKEDGTPVAPRANVCCVRHLIHQVPCRFLLLHCGQLGTCGIPRHSRGVCNSWYVQFRQIALTHLTLGYKTGPWASRMKTHGRNVAANRPSLTIRMNAMEWPRTSTGRFYDHVHFCVVGQDMRYLHR